MERIFKKNKKHNRNTSKLDRERINYPSFRIKFPICIGLAHVNRKGKIYKTGLFTWVSSDEQYQEYISKINSQLEELRDNEHYYIEKEAEINNEIFKLENKELFPEQENNEEEITVKRNKEMLEQELIRTRGIIKTISKIDKETCNMWLITVETAGRKQKLKKIAKIENIILGGF